MRAERVIVVVKRSCTVFGGGKGPIAGSSRQSRRSIHGDKLPGGWGAAKIFERIASSSSSSAAKYNRVWKAVTSKLDSKKSAESRKSYGSYRGRGESRGGFRSFRSVRVYHIPSSFFFVFS